MPDTVEWFEEAPRVRSVLIRQVVRRLSFPWVIMAITREQNAFDSLYAFSRPAPITSIDDTLYRFPLVAEARDDTVGNSHVRSNGSVCMGSSLKNEKDPRLAFWNSNFSECAPHTAIAMWEVLTELSPMSILDVRLKPLEHTPAMWKLKLVGDAPWVANGRRAMRFAEGQMIARRAFGAAA
jgi:hypothetical protein